jgi:hypothetical protein
MRFKNARGIAQRFSKADVCRIAKRTASQNSARRSKSEQSQVCFSTEKTEFGSDGFFSTRSELDFAVCVGRNFLGMFHSKSIADGLQHFDFARACKFALVQRRAAGFAFWMWDAMVASDHRHFLLRLSSSADFRRLGIGLARI